MLLQKCPECAQDITSQNHRAHALSHWPETLPRDPTTLEARQRQQALYDSFRVQRAALELAAAEFSALPEPHA